jgi:hypothetical protein
VASRIRDLPATARTSIIFISGADGAPTHRSLTPGSRPSSAYKSLR